MAFPAALVTRGASDLTDLRDQLEAGGKQADVLAAEGHYLEIPLNMPKVPEDEVAETVDDTVKPAYRATSPSSWTITLQATSPVATLVFESNGPGGKGWFFCQLAVVLGNLWRKNTWVVNPDGFADIDWTEDTED